MSRLRFGAEEDRENTKGRKPEMRFAEHTSVPVEKSRAEIESTLRRFGAERFISGWDQRLAVIGFVYRERSIRFELPLPDPTEKRFAFTPAGKSRRTDADRLKAWEQGCRENWRALAAVIKAKLVAVETGITTFEQEFLAHIVLPGGETVGQFVIPKLGDVYHAANAQLLLPAPRPRSAPSPKTA